MVSYGDHSMDKKVRKLHETSWKRLSVTKFWEGVVWKLVPAWTTATTDVFSLLLSLTAMRICVANKVPTNERY